MNCYNYKTLLNHPSVVNVVGIYCNKLDNLDFFPSHVISLRLVRCKQPYVDHLPPSLETLELVGNHFWNKPLDYLPATLKQLIINKDIEDDVYFDHLPECLTHLTLLYFWNCPIDHLPHSLTHLTIGKDFNKPVDHLPSSLIYLSITSYNFNQPIDHLPSSLTQLLLGLDFNQSIDYLPDSLLYLEFGTSSKFNQPIAYLPSHLISLTLGKKFKSSLDYLPHFLTHLSLYHCKSRYSLDYLPSSIISLSLGAPVNIE